MEDINMKTLQILKSGYFCGNKISEYGLQNGYLDYATLAKAFDAVLCNDITKLFYSDINGEYNEVEQINGYIDNSDEIEELNDRISELMLDNENDEHTAEIDKIQEQIDELENEQNYPPEIYQYYIISDNGKRIIEEFTNDPLFYIPALDVYVWGVTHWGTSWDYVLTDTKLIYTEE
jgi:hypothetical protein